MIGGNRGAVLAGAGFTFVGVPAGLALSGGNVFGVMTFTLAVLLAGAMLELVISPLTAKTHITRAITKLGVRDRVQLVILAYQDGLVGPLS